MEAPAQSAKVRVYGNAWRTKGVSQHHVGSLTTHSRKSDQFFQGSRNHPVELRLNLDRQTFYIPSFGSEESSGVHERLDVKQFRSSKILRCSVLPKEGRGHLIDTLVRALGREHRRNQQLQRALEIQFAMHLRVGLGEDPVDRASALHGLRIGHHALEITRQRPQGETLAHLLVKSPRDSRRSDCSPRSLIYRP